MYIGSNQDEDEDEEMNFESKPSNPDPHNFTDTS